MKNFANCLVMVVLTALFPGTSAADDSEMTDLMFVQSASGGVYEDGLLVMDGVYHTTFFSESPDRMVGVFDNTDFSEYMDSYMSDYQPNASLVIPGNDEEIILEILDAPVLEDSILKYQVRVISGEIPEHFPMAALFIDAIPTPVNGMITDAETEAATTVSPMITD